jgi:hypothetical protein
MTGALTFEANAIKHKGSFKTSRVMDGKLTPCIETGGELSTSLVMDGKLSIDLKMDGQYGRLYSYGTAADEYSGPTVVTPTEETQTLSTAGLALAQNITVNPIPSNYGLITWDGSVLTVS